MEEVLHNPLYEHLFKGVPDEEKNLMYDVIRTVAGFLEKNKRFLGDEESRGVLVYQLAGIPLEEIPKWLDAYQEYYAKRQEMMFPFNCRSVCIGPLKTTFPWPKIGKNLCESIGQLVADADRFKDEAEKIVFSMGSSSREAKKKVSKVLKKFNGLYKEAEEEAEKLTRNGAVMPHYYVDYQNVPWMGNVDAEKLKTEARDEICSAVLNAVRDFPQDEVDAISEYFAGRGGDESPVSLQALEKMIRSVADSKKSGQKCRVQFNDGLYGNSFATGVSFIPNEEEKQKGVTETTMNIFFHSRKFKLVNNFSEE